MIAYQLHIRPLAFNFHFQLPVRRMMKAFRNKSTHLPESPTGVRHHMRAPKSSRAPHFETGVIRSDEHTNSGGKKLYILAGCLFEGDGFGANFSERAKRQENVCLPSVWARSYMLPGHATSRVVKCTSGKEAFLLKQSFFNRKANKHLKSLPTHALPCSFGGGGARALYNICSFSGGRSGLG